MRVPLLPLLAGLLAAPALAGSAQEESWTPFPGQETPAAKLPPARNRVSLFGARSLGEGQRALGLSLGFPLVTVKASLGVLSRVDVGVGVDSLYGVMTNVHLHARASLLEGENWALAAAVEGGYAVFLKSSLEEFEGARFLTGRRNWNLLPGLVASYQGDSARAPRFFLDVRYHLALDTEPFMRTPLGGVSGAQVSGNVPVRLGLEVPFSERTSYVIMVGADFHGRPEDTAFMPAVGVGLVTAL